MITDVCERRLTTELTIALQFEISLKCRHLLVFVHKGAKTVNGGQRQHVVDGTKTLARQQAIALYSLKSFSNLSCSLL